MYALAAVCAMLSALNLLYYDKAVTCIDRLFFSGPMSERTHRRACICVKPYSSIPDVAIDRERRDNRVSASEILIYRVLYRKLRTDGADIVSSPARDIKRIQ
jgi:hypothetical protein